MGGGLMYKKEHPELIECTIIHLKVRLKLNKPILTIKVNCNITRNKRKKFRFKLKIFL